MLITERNTLLHEAHILLDEIELTITAMFAAALLVQ